MGPFSVSANGARVQTASGPQLLLASKNPLTKLDTTNIVSFQTISLLFNNEPPQPGPDAFTDTQLYQFAHGYDYIPAFWMTWQNPTPEFPPPPIAPGDTATTFHAFGDETASANIPAVGGATHLSLLGVIAYNDVFNGVDDYMSAFLYLVVDDTSVTLFVRKTTLQVTSGGAVIPIHLAGVSVNMRVYVFTEPATTSVY